MLATAVPDHRRRSDADVLEFLRSGDALALAEAYRRTIDAGHGGARRLLGSPREVEALLLAVYTELWAAPPSGEALEGWIRRRCFSLGAAHLAASGRLPAAPSLAAHVSGRPQPDTAGSGEAEATLAGLPPADLQALLLAHDRGIPASEQDDPDAPRALARALLAVAGAAPGGRDVTQPALADHALGLGDPSTATHVAEVVARDADAAALLRTYRRARRRLEGLPPTADMGQRILAAVLSAGRDAVVSRRPSGDVPEDVLPEEVAAAPRGPQVAAGPRGPQVAHDAPGPLADDAPAADTPGPSADGGPASPQEADAASAQDTGQRRWPVDDAETRDPWTGEEPSPFFGDLVDTEPDRGPDAVAPPLRVDTDGTDEDEDLDGPTSEAVETTRSRVVRWVAIVVLLVLGVLVGIQIGEMLLS